jgi:BirA family biotin operon repressor/biotin-[acetyl-CoA-carboxylase] ligase
LLTLVPALALVDAVHALSGGSLRPGIKWVNDVLLEGRKIGGALTATETQGDRVRALLLGIGLNVACRPYPGVRASVSCLADSGTAVTLARPRAASPAVGCRARPQQLARRPSSRPTATLR